MSSTLFALVILQGTGLSFSPGYTSASECMQQYKGPYVSCFAYDPDSTTWTAFFKLPTGGFRTVGRINSEDECKRYIGAFKDGIPTACRQLAQPVTCNIACVAPVPAPPPAAKPVESDPKPDPASIDTKPSDIQVGGKQYTKVAGLTWVESSDGAPPSTKPLQSFADVSVGPTELQSKDRPTPLPPRVQTAQAPQGRYVPKQYAQHPEPLKALIDVVMLPFDFLAYPGRRDW
jgi:hypothetical protein